MLRVASRGMVSGRLLARRCRAPAQLGSETGGYRHRNVPIIPAELSQENRSLPWNHQESLCAPPFPQVALDRTGRSYRFSFGMVMRSLQWWVGSSRL